MESGGAIRQVAILGAGGWGTALAVHLARIGHDARLWAREAAFAEEIRLRRANAVYLPDIRFPARLRVTADLQQAVRDVASLGGAGSFHGRRQLRTQVSSPARPGVESVRGVGSMLPGAGGSAMPCGLVLPAARAKVNMADWIPEVRLAAAVYW